MEKDFHFYAMALLARHAGFREEESILIATVSQYVDDAVDSEPLYLIDGRVVETTMTAHYHLLSFHHGVQNKVFLPFHFPPCGLGSDGFDFRCEENSPLMNSYLQHIYDDDHLSLPLDNQGLSFTLYRLGIALHTYADSWPHAGFSSRCHPENDVGRIWFKENGRFRRQFLEDWLFDLAPQIGHAECGNHPDVPWREMKFERWDVSTGQFTIVARDNPVLFEAAAKSCLKWLRRFSASGSDSSTAWNHRAPAMRALKDLLTRRDLSVDERISEWKKGDAFEPFSSLFFGPRDYDRQRWRREAIDEPQKKTSLAQTKIGREERETARNNFDLSSYRLFHKAAHAQRDFLITSLFWR